MWLRDKNLILNRTPEINLFIWLRDKNKLILSESGVSGGGEIIQSILSIFCFLSASSHLFDSGKRGDGIYVWTLQSEEHKFSPDSYYDDNVFWMDYCGHL